MSDADLTAGARKLSGFLRDNKIRNSAAADALGVSDVAIHHWLNGNARPKDALRAKIAIWTRGEVPVESWVTGTERADIESTVPHTASDFGKAAGE